MGLEESERNIVWMNPPRTTDGMFVTKKCERGQELTVWQTIKMITNELLMPYKICWW